MYVASLQLHINIDNQYYKFKISKIWKYIGNSLKKMANEKLIMYFLLSGLLTLEEAEHARKTLEILGDMLHRMKGMELTNMN
jgi:hypothetical protein